MTDTTVQAPAGAVLYAEVLQFYARHFQLLDEGHAEEWAATFTEDGFFAPEHKPEPAVGRAVLARGARAAYEGLVKEGRVRRHHHTMVAVDEPGPDGAVRVRCYAIILSTTVGGPTGVDMSCVCEDVLVREDGRLLVRERRVTKDGVAAPVL